MRGQVRFILFVCVHLIWCSCSELKNDGLVLSTQVVDVVARLINSAVADSEILMSQSQEKMSLRDFTDVICALHGTGSKGCYERSWAQIKIDWRNLYGSFFMKGRLHTTVKQNGGLMEHLNVKIKGTLNEFTTTFVPL